MSSNPPPDGTVPWWKDPPTLAILTPIVGIILKIIQINFGSWIAAHLHVAVNTWTAENVLTYVGGVAALVTTRYLIRRRIKRGQDPNDPSRKLVGGPIARTILNVDKPTAVVDEFKAVVESPPPPQSFPPMKAGMTDDELAEFVRKHQEKAPKSQ